MKYFHRTHLAPEAVLEQATAYFSTRMGPIDEAPGLRRFASAIGQVTVRVEAEGGHYTRVTVETNQLGESEVDKVAKRFLTLVHTAAEPTHRPIGAY